MSNVVIVAIPEQDDYVWKVSSEKVPHMTILSLGEQEPGPALAQVESYLQHAVETMLHKFGMSVERRDVLGPKEADVLIFDKSYCSQELKDFRDALLKEPNILQFFNESPQFAEWTPHLTLGYPETPANPDERDYPGVHWVNFDKIALWVNDFDGPEIHLTGHESFLMSDLQEAFDLNRKVETIDLTHDRVFDESKVTRKGGKFAPKGTVDTDEAWAKGDNLRKIHMRILKARGLQIAQSTKAILEKHGLKPGDSLEGHPKAQRQILTAAVQIMNSASKTLGVSPSGASRLNFAVNKAGDHIYLASVPNKDVHRVAGRRVDPVEHATDETSALSSDIKISVDDVLQYGRLGMKWGVRRRRGSDGKVVGNVPASDAAQAAELRRKIGRRGDLSKLSNEDLQKLVTRINLENNLARAAGESSKVMKANALAKKGLDLGKTVNEAINFATSPAGELIVSTISGKNQGVGLHQKLKLAKAAANPGKKKNKGP